MKRKQGKGKKKPKASAPVTANGNQAVQDIARYYNEVNMDVEPSGDANINSRMEGEAPQKENIVNNPLIDFGTIVLAKARVDDTMSSCATPPPVSVNPSKKSKSLVKRSARGVSSSMRTNNNALDGAQVERPFQLPHKDNMSSCAAPPPVSVNPNKKSKSLVKKSARGVASSMRTNSNAVDGEQVERPIQLPHKDAIYKDEELKTALEVIGKVMELDAALPFNIPVDGTEVPDYYDIIDTPMDFGTILRNLETRVKYKNAKDVLCDAEHIWNNCFKYNKKGSFIMELGKRVMNKFLKLWTEAGLDKEPGKDINGSPHVSPAMPAPSFITHGNRISVEHTVDHLQHNLAESNLGDLRQSMSCIQSVHPHMNYFQPNPSFCQMPHPQAHTDSVTGMVRQSHGQGYSMHPVVDCWTCSQRNQMRGESQHHYHPLPLSSKATYQTHQDYLYPDQPHSSLPYTEMGAAHGDPMTRYNKHVPQSPWCPMTNCHQHDHAALHQRQPHQVSTTHVHHHQPEHCTYQNHPSFSQPQPYQLPTDTGRDIHGDFELTRPDESIQRVPKRKPSLPEGLVTNNQPRQEDQIRSSRPNAIIGDFELTGPNESMQRAPKRKPSLPEGLETNNQSRQEDQIRSSRPSAINGDFTLTRPDESMQRTRKRKPSLPEGLETNNQPQQEDQIRSSRPSSIIGDFALAQPDESMQRAPKRKPSLPEGLVTNNQPQQEDQIRSSRPSTIIDFSIAPPAESRKRDPKHKASLPAGLVTNNHPQQEVQVQSCRPGAVIGNAPPSPTMTASGAMTIRHESRHQAEPVDNNQNSMPLVNFSEGSHDFNVDNTEPQPSTPSPDPDGIAEDCVITGNSTKKKRNRNGPTDSLDLWNSTTKITILFDEFGQPIGDETPKLITFLGTLARNGELAPLNYVDWRTVPKINKEKMWILVQSKFDIDPKNRNWITKSVGKKWKDWKAHLKSTHYLVYDNDKDRLAACDERVFPDQWKVIVEFWNSDLSKERSIKAKASRSLQKIHHTTGRKSFARIREEQRSKMPDREPPSKADLFIFTRTRKDGQPINEESSKLISALREKAAQHPGGTSNDGGIAVADDVFSDVVKITRSNMFGPVQPTPQMRVASMLSKVNDSVEAIQFVSEAKQEVVEMKQKMVSMEQSYAQMTDQMTKLVSIMSDMHSKNPPEEPVPDVPNAIILPSSPVHVERVADVTTPNNNSVNSDKSSSKELFELSSQRTTRKRVIQQRKSTRKKVARKK